MKLRTTRHFLVALAVWLSGLEGFCQVIYEKTLPKGEPGRYEVKDYVASYISDGLIEAYKRTQTVLRLEIRDGHLHVRTFRDLEKEAEGAATKAAHRKWMRDFFDTYVLKKDIGRFRYKSGSGASRSDTGSWVRFTLSGPRVADIDALYVQPDGDHAVAAVYEVEGDEMTLHGILRKVVKGKMSLCRARQGVYIRSVVDEGPAKRTWYTWRSAKRAAFYVYSVECDPKELAQGYLAHFPSDLPDHVNLDKAEWARAETDYCLGLMGQMFDAPEPDSYPLSSPRCFEFLSRNALIPPHVARIQYSDPVSARREPYQRVRKWWEENRERSYWDKRYGKLAVKGQTPEDLAKAEEKRIRKEIEAKLDAELTEDDLKRITEAVIRKLEGRMQYLADLANKALGTDSGCKFEKVAEKKWHRYFRHSRGSPLYQVTITGPKLRKWRDRKNPLVAEFRCVLRNQETGKKFEEKILYHYRKLEDRWGEGPPPK